jgi:hypothetical protein
MEWTARSLRAIRKIWVWWECARRILLAMLLVLPRCGQNGPTPAKLPRERRHEDVEVGPRCRQFGDSMLDACGLRIELERQCTFVPYPKHAFHDKPAFRCHRDSLRRFIAFVYRSLTGPRHLTRLFIANKPAETNACVGEDAPLAKCVDLASSSG